MYFEFEDYKPDISPIGGAISWREGVLLSIIAHLLGVIALLLAPRYLPASFFRTPPVQIVKNEPPDQERFVFVNPRVDMRALAPPKQAEPSDMDREARTVQRPKDPTNTMPFSRGNTSERVERAEQSPPPGKGPEPEPAAGAPSQAQAEPEPQELPQSPSSFQLPAPTQSARNGANGSRPLGGGSLGDALRNLDRYVQDDQFDNPSGGGGAFGPEIQFDTKGVEFGPWIRRFIAQVKRNWLIPYAAMSMKGHVVMTFNVHKDGSITDLQVAGPSSVGAFNNAAYGALATSNPTAALPPEYPADKAFFTVTFFYNEDPK
jgi:TonB family protein